MGLRSIYAKTVRDSRRAALVVGLFLLVLAGVAAWDASRLTITSTYDDSVKIAKGELDANAAFMQGRMKVTGNMGKLMSLMPLTQSPEYKAIQAKIAEKTEF